EIEDTWNDDFVSTRKERHAPAEGSRMPRFRRPQRGNRHGRVEHVRQWRPRRRSSTADVLGSAALNSSMKARTLRRVTLAVRGRARGAGASATSTGTIAAAGLP